MKVLLLNPPADDGVRQVREGRCMQRAGAWTAIWTPLSLAYCAAVLREDGFEVSLIDSIIEERSFDSLREYIGDYRPDAVIINAVTPSIKSDLSTADYIKNVDPHIIVAVIGIHGSALPDETLAMNSNVDFVVRHEPEMVVRNLCRSLREGGNGKSVKGLSYRQEEGYRHNETEDFIDDLDILPYPAYDLIQTEKYTLPFSHKRFLLIATGRGCNFGCNFCADHVYYGRKVRLRSPQRVVEELAHWEQRLGIRDYLFWSESFTLNRQYACEVSYRIIESGLKINWICNSRVDHVDDDMLALFRQAGCSLIGYGVESGKDETLKRMNKRMSKEQIERAVSLARKNGIEVVAHTILGFPGESEEDIKETVRFVKKLDIGFAQFYCAVPFPGSRLYEEARKNGWIASSDWRMFEQNFSVLQYEGMCPLRIMELRRKAYLSFYLRPKAFSRFARRLAAEGSARKGLGILRDFLSWI